jgi:membrane-associated phospholipid phosphatase
MRRARGRAPLRPSLPALLLVAAVLLDVGMPPASAAEPEPPLPRKTFREAARTFFDDGAYLFTFPARTNAEGAWLTAGFTAGTLLLIERDDAIREEVLESDSHAADRLGHLFEPLGRASVEAAALGVFYATGRLTRHARATDTAATAFEAYLWTFVITSAAKAAFGRERPSGDADAHGFFEKETIFPSGHTSRSFAIAAVLADRYGRPAAWFAYPVAALAGLATVQQDTHWASDVLAGAGLGLAIGKGIASRHRWSTETGAPAAGAAAPPAQWQVRPLPGGALLSYRY